MAKITRLFKGDTFINTQSTEVLIVDVNSSGGVLMASDSWSKEYNGTHKGVLDSINRGLYKNYKTVIPEKYHIRVTGETIPSFQVDLWELVSRLIHKLDGTNRPRMGDYLFVRGNRTTMHHVGTKFISSHPVTTDKFISIYNTISFNSNNKNGSKNQESKRYTENPCNEIFIDEKGVTSSESRGQDEGEVRLSSKVRKIRLEEGETGTKVSVKRQGGRIKIPTIQFSLFDKSVCRR